MWQQWRRWLRARMTLGWALAKHLMMGPWAHTRTNPTRWLGAMARESLGATPKANWQHFAKSARCIGCGLCDLYGTPKLPRPSELLVGGARLPADAPLMRQQAAEVRLLREPILKICPTGVDTHDIAALIDNNAEVLETILKGGAAQPPMQR